MRFYLRLWAQAMKTYRDPDFADWYARNISSGNTLHHAYLLYRAKTNVKREGEDS